tara:strand:+ start:9843 stop:10535 length:693 start_codon:yes stop_codon:yes gene_type:complete
MSGMEVPLIMAGVQGLGHYMSGSAEGRTGFGASMPYGPNIMAANQLDNLNRLGAVNTQFASSPVTMPSAYVQPLPMFKGGGMPVDVFASGADPALARPELLFRPGVDWGDKSKDAYPPFYSEAGQKTFQSASQGVGDWDADNPMGQYSYRMPQFGGANYAPMANPAQISELENALGLLGTKKDNFGNYVFGGARGLTNLQRLKAVGRDKSGGDPDNGGGDPDIPEIPKTD